MIDLHIHTDASSDGQHSPGEIFQMAARKKIRVLAFADHNTVDNLAEGVRLSRKTGIEFISCLELNTFYQGLDLHLLAYFIDPESRDLKSWLQEIQHKKEAQALKRVERLNELGFSCTWEAVGKFSGTRVPTGRSFLKAILSRPENNGDPRLNPYLTGERARSPYVNFYRDYLRGGKPAFVPMEDSSTTAAIRRIEALGAIPVLAHPSDTGEEIILQLVKNGLQGLEVYSSYHTPAEEAAFLILAQKHGLLITAGSDFHGREVKPDVELGQVRGDHQEILHRLKAHRG